MDRFQKWGKRGFLIAIGFCLTGAVLFGQNSIDVEKLRSYIEDSRRNWEIPGLAVGIIKNGEVVLSDGFGTAELGRKDEIDGETIFAIASNTKAFITAAIGILVDEEALNWDDPVRKHIPDFALYDDYVSQHTTVRDLLCHRAGLGTFSGDVIWYKSDLTPEELLTKIPHIPPAYDFRAGYGYSNLMFITAGEVIRAVTGKSWDVFVRERIFEPLDMHRTATTVNILSRKSNVATPHKLGTDGHFPIPYVNWDNMGAAGGVLSSADDMLKWLQLQIAAGVVGTDTVFSKSVQYEWWKPHNSFKVTDGTKRLFPTRNFSSYGLGWGLFDYHGRKVVRHGGGYDGMYSQVAIVPSDSLGIVVLTNGMQGIGGYLVYYIMDRFMNNEVKDWSKVGLERQIKNAEREKEERKALLSKRLPNTSPSVDESKFTGLYRDPMFGDIEVTNDEGGLHLNFVTAPNLNASLSHWHLNTYEIIWNEIHAWFDFGTVQFILDNYGEGKALSFDVPNHDIFFHEINAVRVE